MEAAEVVSGYIFGIVVGNAVEGARRGVPKWTKEVADFLAMKKD